MEQYVGLDVSLKETSLCVVDQTGTTLWQGKCASTPESIAAVVARRAPGATRIGLESGLLSTWHWHALKALGVPSGEWLESGGGVISGLFNQPGPALSRRRRSRHDNR